MAGDGSLLSAQSRQITGTLSHMGRSQIQHVELQSLVAVPLVHFQVIRHVNPHVTPQPRRVMALPEGDGVLNDAAVVHERTA